jgi:hypothetical protein
MQKNQIALEENSALNDHFINFTLPSIEEILLNLELKINKIDDKNFMDYFNNSTEEKKASLYNDINILKNFLKLKTYNKGTAAEIKYFLNNIQIKAMEYAQKDKRFEHLISKRYEQATHGINDIIIAHKKSIIKK